MTLRKKLLLMFNFRDNEVNELALAQEQDQKNEVPLEPPWVGVDKSGRLRTHQRSIKDRELKDNETTTR